MNNSRLSYIIPKNGLRFFPEFPIKSSKVLLEMYKILLRLSKIPEISQEISFKVVSWLISLVRN